MSLDQGGGAVGGMAFVSKRQPYLYWRQIEQLKAAAVCIRLYRNRLARRVRGIEIVKAVASSGAIAGWAASRSYPFVWGSIIAAAQLLDALKDVFPFAKLHKQAADLTVAFELLLIDAEDEWEKIHIGNFSDEMILERRTRLKKLQQEAEQKHFPEGFEPDKKLLALAKQESRTYFQTIYDIEAKR